MSKENLKQLRSHYTLVSASLFFLQMGFMAFSLTSTEVLVQMLNEKGDILYKTIIKK